MQSLLSLKLRTKAHAALKGNGLAVHVLEVGVSELNANSADLGFGIAEVTCGRHLYVSLECLGICLFEVLELCGPSERTYYVGVDAVLCPLGGGNAGKTADRLLGGGVRRELFEVTYISVEADFATQSATSARGDFDIRTFEVKMTPLSPMPLRAGMSVIVELEKPSKR